MSMSIIRGEHVEGWTTGSKLICLFPVSISSIIAAIQAAISIGLLLSLDNTTDEERKRGSFN